MSATAVYFYVNLVIGGVPFPIAFSQSLPFPLGSLVGRGDWRRSGCAGKLASGLNACRVTVSDVFARVA